MRGERYVALGLAHARSGWFSELARWSTSAAVLIVAFLGAAMYVIFTQILTSSGSKASTQVNNIGGGGP
jgi:hypothetical protein